MDNKRRGLALIFNQERFFWRLGLRERHGTNADSYNLQRRYFIMLEFTRVPQCLATSIFYCVTLCVTCSSQAEGVKLWGEGFWQQHTSTSPGNNHQWWAPSWTDCNESNRTHPVHSDYHFVSPAAKDDHSNVDCFLVVFLSHGENDHIYTFDDKINVQDITSLFKGDKCKSLVGKPKIFILQVSGVALKSTCACWSVCDAPVCPSPGVPRRQARRAGDGCRFWRRGQRVEKKRGGSGRQRCLHPSCRGRFHHVLLSGWRWDCCGWPVWPR